MHVIALGKYCRRSKPYEKHKSNRHQPTMFQATPTTFATTKGTESVSAKIIQIMFHDVAQQIQKKNREHGSSSLAWNVPHLGEETKKICLISFRFFLFQCITSKLQSLILYSTIASANPFPSEVKVQIHNAFV